MAEHDTPDPGSIRARLGGDRVIDGDPGESQPGDAQPGESQPGDAQPGESQPGDAQDQLEVQGLAAQQAADAASGMPTGRDSAAAMATSASGQGAGAGQAATGDAGTIVRPTGMVEDLDPRAERRAVRTVGVLFQLSALCSVGFVAVYVVGDTHKVYYTPALGLLLGVALLLIGAAAVVWAKRVMPDVEAVQERHAFSDPAETAAAAGMWQAGVADSGFTKHAFIRRSFLGSISILTLLPIVLLRSLGVQPKKSLEHTHWFPGSLLIDFVKGTPVSRDTLEAGGYLTVIPELPDTLSDVERNNAIADSIALLIKLRPGDNKPLQGRETWTVDDNIAYSKLCTHLGCPVGLYEQQTHKLLCPCHQSQFLVTEHARPVFGPAARNLAQLALTVDDQGHLRAQHDFIEPVGPGYWERT